MDNQNIQNISPVYYPVHPLLPELSKHLSHRIRRNISRIRLINADGLPPQPHEEWAYLYNDIYQHALDFHAWEKCTQLHSEYLPPNIRSWGTSSFEAYLRKLEPRVCEWEEHCSAFEVMVHNLRLEHVRILLGPEIREWAFGHPSWQRKEVMIEGELQVFKDRITTYLAARALQAEPARNQDAAASIDSAMQAIDQGIPGNPADGSGPLEMNSNTSLEGESNTGPEMIDNTFPDLGDSTPLEIDDNTFLEMIESMLL